MDRVNRLTRKGFLILSAVACYIVMATIGLITTSGVSRLFVEPLRGVAISLVVCFSATLLVTVKMNTVHLISVLSYSFFFLIGLTLAELNGVEQAYNKYFFDFLVVLPGLFVFAYMTSNYVHLDHVLAKFIFIYCVCALLLTIMVGGLVFAVPPRFVFDYVSELVAKEVIYSQGVSKFFGYGALAASFLFVQTASNSKKVFLGSAIAVFLTLSLLGGARGDSILAVFVVAVYLLITYKLRIFWPVVALALIMILFFVDAKFLDELVIVQRIQSAGGGYGYRDVLLFQVGELLANRADCILTGCGFGFFQHYFDYPLGLYPHNLVAELVIIYGVPLSLILLVACAMGVVKAHRTSGVTFLMLFFVYTFLLGLKSGGVSSSWLLMVLVITYFARYVAFRVGYRECV